MGFLAWIKNGTKGTYGLQMPAFFPASRVTYDGGTLDQCQVKTYKRDIGGVSLSAQSSGVNYAVIIPSALTGHKVISIFTIDSFYGDLNFLPFEQDNGTNPGVIIYSNTRTTVPTGLKIGFRYI